MKVSILTPDVSHNCLSRAYLLAQLLSKKYQVEILGPRFGNGIWFPLKDMQDVVIKSVKVDFKTNRVNWKLLFKMIDGDIIYASKPHVSSFGIGLLAKFLKRKPLILDIDDYEPGFWKGAYAKLSFWKKIKLLFSTQDPLRLYQWMLFLNKLTFLANTITVASKGLQNIYGGTLIPHARDTSVFKPVEYTNHTPVIGFIGTIRPHKGISDLVGTLVLLRKRNFLCVITESGDEKYIKSLKNFIKTTKMENKIQFIPPLPFKFLPQTLSTIDIIVIPQNKFLAAQYQVPAKLIDAMAMGKAIVATNVSDISEILSDCGMVIPSSNVFFLTIAVQAMLDDVKRRRMFGEKARERCVKYYDTKVVRKKLHKVFKPYMEGR